MTSIDKLHENNEINDEQRKQLLEAVSDIVNAPDSGDYATQYETGHKKIMLYPEHDQANLVSRIEMQVSDLVSNEHGTSEEVLEIFEIRHEIGSQGVETEHHKPNYLSGPNQSSIEQGVFDTEKLAKVLEYISH